MSVYNITGWSGGGRRPLTYNLRAGQFRNMGGCNIFGTPTRTVINNNFGGYGYECDCGYNNGGGVPSWMQWMMGGGMVMNFLGQMMSAIFPGKESKGTEGKGGLTDAQKTDLAAYKSAVKDIKYTQKSNDNYLVTYTNDKGKKVRKEMSYDELIDLYKSKFETEDEDPDIDSTDATEAQHKYTESEGELLISGLKGKYPKKDLSGLSFKDGKFKLGETTYTTPKELEEAIKKLPDKTDNAEGATGTGTVTGTDTSTNIKYTPNASDGQWYDLFSKKYNIPAGTTPQEIKLAACQLAKISTKNAIVLNANGTISTTTNKGPSSFASSGIELPPKITVDGKTYTLKEST